MDLFIPFGTEKGFEAEIGLAIHSWRQLEKNSPFLICEVPENVSGEIAWRVSLLCCFRNSVDVYESVEEGALDTRQAMDLALLFDASGFLLRPKHRQQEDESHEKDWKLQPHCR